MSKLEFKVVGSGTPYRLEHCLYRPRKTSGVDQIINRENYYFRLIKRKKIDWYVELVSRKNGVLMMRVPFANKSQARNTWKKFADSVGVEWREE